MTTGRNIVRSITLAAGAAISLLAATPSASAQGWDCGGPDWIRLPVLYTTAFGQGLGEGACNIVCGVGKAGREVCYQAIDIGGGVVEICGGPRHQNWSQGGQYFDNGGSYTTYYRDFGCNVATAGVYGQVQSSIAYYNGEIDTTTYSEQMGAAGVFQLCQARVMYVRGGPGCVWRQPIQNVPRHVWARCTGQRTPFDVANGCAPGDRYISPACRGRMGRDPLWEAACAEAENNPFGQLPPEYQAACLEAGGRLPSCADPRCAAAAGSPQGPMVCRSSQPAVLPGPDRWRPPWFPRPGRTHWWPRDFFWETHRHGLTCAEPRAVVCSLRNGQTGPVPTTNGAVINYNGTLYFRPACGPCQSMGNMNPGLINWVNRPPLWLPTDVGAGMCLPQTFAPPGQPIRPGGGPGAGGGGMFVVGPNGELVFVGNDPRGQMGVCPRPGNLGQGGGVDPPFEGTQVETAGGCCSIGAGAGGNRAAPLGGLTLACGVLYLLVRRRRCRGRRRRAGPEEAA